MELKNLNFTEVIRYILTGMNFLIFVVFLPAIYFRLSFINALSDSSVLVLAFFSLAIGYLLDMLKVYQFVPNFNKNKAKFRKRISEVLETPVEHAGSYFSITSKMWDENSSYSFERRRAEWILVLHTAATMFASMFVWGFFVIDSYLKNGFSKSLYFPAIITGIVFLLALRLYRVGMKEIAKDDQEFLLIMSANKKKIKDAWKIIDKN